MIKNYIDGELIEPVSGEYFDNYDPAKGEPYDIVPDSDENDISLAIHAAENAFSLWSDTPYEERSKIMFKIASLMQRNIGELARAVCIDNGKPLSLVRMSKA